MRTADIRVGRTYRLRGGARAMVLETGISGYGYRARKDYVRVDYLDQPEGSERKFRKVPSRDIVREWSAEDDAIVARNRERDEAQDALNEELGALGFTIALATMTRDRETGALVPSLRFKGEEAERVMAILRVHMIP